MGKVEYPDATTGAASSAAADDVTYTDDALGEVTSMTDQNGTTHAYLRDLLGRETLDSVTTLGSGVDGTVRALGTSFNSQGLPSVETSYSNANGTGVVNQDEDVYNGLGQETGEFQSVSGAVNTSTTPEVQYTFSDPSLGSRQTGMEYPNGRELDYVYNSGIDTTIGRVSAIADAAGSSAGNLQSYTYQGVGTIIGFADGNGVTENTTLDSFGREAEIKYVNGSSVTTDDFAYGFDRNGNVLYENNLLNSANSELYHANSTITGDNNTAYDPLNRLGAFERGTLSSSGNNGSTLDTVASASASQSWNLNAVGDQNSVTTGNATTTNTTNAKNELTANGNSTLTFDNNGNTLTDENGLSYTFDAWNHEATVKSGNTTIADYTNDPTGRRITETSGNSTTAIYFSNQWQPIELRQGGNVTSQNVFGLGYVNQLVERDDNSSSGSLGKSGSGLGDRLYAQQNLNWSTTTLVDASGNVVQRMVYLPDGGVSFYTATWAAGSNTAALRSLYQGGWLETANGNYEFQRRDYDPVTGTWKEPDPAGYADGSDDYQGERDNTVNGDDPSGLWKRDSWTMNSGHAVADCCTDTASSLARLITGRTSDAAVLRIQGKVNPGTKVDIVPLLNVLEERLRCNVVGATLSIRAPFPALGSQKFFNGDEEGGFDFQPYFAGGNDAIPLDCKGGARAVLAKGLFDTLLPGEWGRLYNTNSMPLVDLSYSNAHQAKIGDWLYFENGFDYAQVHGEEAQFSGENVIVVGADEYWGFTGAANNGLVRSESEWNHMLAESYNQGLTECEQIDKAPGLTRGKFFNVPQIGMDVFDFRNK